MILLLNKACKWYSTEECKETLLVMDKKIHKYKGTIYRQIPKHPSLLITIELGQRTMIHGDSL
jgi:hypothetical protein